MTRELSFRVNIPDYDIDIDDDDKEEIDENIPDEIEEDDESNWDIVIPPDVSIGENITYYAIINGEERVD